MNVGKISHALMLERLFRTVNKGEKENLDLNEILIRQKFKRKNRQIELLKLYARYLIKQRRW